MRGIELEPTLQALKISGTSPDGRGRYLAVCPLCGHKDLQLDPRGREEVIPTCRRHCYQYKLIEKLKEMADGSSNGHHEPESVSSAPSQEINVKTGPLGNGHRRDRAPETTEDLGDLFAFEEPEPEVSEASPPEPVSKKSAKKTPDLEIVAMKARIVTNPRTGQEEYLKFQARCVARFGPEAGILLRELTFWTGHSTKLSGGWIY